MAALLIKNNAYSTVATWTIGVGTGTFTVASSEGARFPTITGGDWFYVTLQDSSNNIEIVKITARATDTLTVGERAVEGTTARTWVATDVVELRLTAATAVATDTTQTLTNKTLTAPVLSGTATGTYTLGGTPTITAPVLSGTVTGTYTLGGTPTITAPVLSGTVTGTYTLGGTPSIAVTALTGLGANVGTFLATPTSTNLRTAVATTSTGTGSLVFHTSPTFVTPVLGTPTSGNLSTCTADGTNAVGFRHVPQITKVANGAPTTGADLTYAGKHVYHTSTAGTFTIPANASIAYVIGTALTFVNGNGAGDLTIAITTDTMYLAGDGTTGSRTLAANGVATALKTSATTWIISGTGLS